MGQLRLATDDDSKGVIDLIGGVFAEYRGVILDVDREEPELRAPASRFERFWVIEEAGEIVGCIACAFKHDHVELKKLYVRAAERGEGYARLLVDLVEKEAGASGRIELWSDTRFTDAHGLYEHLGYERTGRERDLNDQSQTREYHFAKRM